MALTIAIRYSFYRRQFADINNPSEETKIINYQIQQFKLFKPLAFLYGILFSHQYLIQAYLTAEEEVKKKQVKSLKFAHGLASLFKALFTNNVINGIELCRKSCGGHGYLMASGLPIIYNNYLPTLTYEGDSSVLILQAIKVIVSKDSQKAENAFSFVFRDRIIPQGNLLSSQFQQQCFQTVAQYKMQLLLTKYSILLKKGHTKEKI